MIKNVFIEHILVTFVLSLRIESVFGMESLKTDDTSSIANELYPIQPGSRMLLPKEIKDMLKPDPTYSASYLEFKDGTVEENLSKMLEIYRKLPPEFKWSFGLYCPTFAERLNSLMTKSEK